MSPRATRGVSRTRTPFEVAILAIAVAASLAILAGLVVAGVRYGGGPPELRVNVTPDTSTAGGRTFEVTVANDGGTSALNVVVTVEIGAETREVELDAVAKGDKESVTVVFPATVSGIPTAEVQSYTEP